MLRWVIVCVLLAQTFGLSKSSRRPWPHWMKPPKHTVRLPTLEDLPEVTIPDIDWPEVTIPDIDWPVTIPDIDWPEVTIPDIDWPDVTIPDVDWPEFPTKFRKDIPNIQLDQHRPTQSSTQQPAKPRKRRPQPSEGPPQRRKLVRADRKSRKMSTGHRQSVPRIEPSMTQQVDEFRSGMPLVMQEQLNDTFDSIKRKLRQGSLMMDSWADNINTAAREWWSKWTGRRNTDFRLTDGILGVTTGDKRPTSWRHVTYRLRDRNHNQTTDNPQRLHSHGDRPHSRSDHPHSRGDRPHSRGDHPHSRGESRYPSDGQLNKRRWNSRCRRPFRPLTEESSREEPAYEVLCGGNDYEARIYNSSVWVSVTVKALTYDIAAYQGFKKLFDYINGNNMNGTKIPMTIPVRSKVKWNSRERRWFERHNYTISFYLPEDLHGNPPTPNNPELSIEYEAPTLYYAHTFRGYALEFNIWEYLEELTNTLDVSQESYKMEDFWVNVYDSPWKLFNRHNDILVAMDTNVQNAPRCLAPTTEMPMTPTGNSSAAPPKTTIIDRTSSVTKTMAKTTTKTAPTASPTTDKLTTDSGLLPVPAEINSNSLQNPFENNDLEQQLSVGCEPGSECPRHTTYVTYDGFELRHYAYSRWICIDQAACDIERAQEITQGLLLDYFYPKGNREQITMNPTTPLVIGLDVADLNSTDCNKVYTSCMFIPEEYQSAPPTPRDARLFIEEIPAMSRYVKSFGGFATSQNVPKLGVEFLMELENSQQLYDGSILAVAQYTTSKLAKTRINELWVMDQSLLYGGEFPVA